MDEAFIPTVDLSPFLREDEDGRKKAMEAITEACSEYGFFQIVNHGVSLDLIKEALQLSKSFFDYSDEEKNKSSASSDAPLPAGYNRQPLHSPDKNEYLLVFPPESSFNVFPQNPPNFRDVVEEMFVQMSKMGVLLETIINECLGLPTNFLKEFNNDRSWDFMVALRYFPASNNENNGITEHEDGNCLTFVIQDGVGGLQVRKNGEWIPVVPAEGTIVVNVGDVIQVLSNKKFKSATHRVVRTKGRSRYSYVFFHNLTGDKWIEPLPQFTKDIGEPPKYRGFQFKEYQELRMRNKSHPPSRPEDVIHITHYAIDT
ncbi:flavonol synthase/flavanone 3-hydroxylase [Cajanus cajan]|uniref:Flavonol synthase/flavanone 3-hydroxylase n=1 Tax=Cajanus cajan TaxID=3821 RepID=A0A151RZB2_CAJCA|nr:flavonol synthase/flavanone 3-hydroxylase [Cajanus cajan]KYP47876.1 Flavonol synthase/flavanone 3-hydroxylase [Cajanus cajan]